MLISKSNVGILPYQNLLINISMHWAALKWRALSLSSSCMMFMPHFRAKSPSSPFYYPSISHSFLTHGNKHLLYELLKILILHGSSEPLLLNAPFFSPTVKRQGYQTVIFLAERESCGSVIRINTLINTLTHDSYQDQSIKK